MRVVLQRAKCASVQVDNEVVGEIKAGLVLLVGLTHNDTKEDVLFLRGKVAHLRIFSDENDKMNLSVLDIGGSVLSISQFTLYGDCRKGRRPNFMAAAKPDIAKDLYQLFNRTLEAKGISVEEGVFGAHMDVGLVNDGPVTLIIES